MSGHQSNSSEKVQVHTPTPWFLGPPDAEGAWELRVGSDKGAWLLRLSSIDGTEEERAEDEANAAFIVRAVNNHDALIAALRSIETLAALGLNTDPDHAVADFAAIAASARTAIQRAT